MTKAKACEQVRWALGFLSYVGAGAAVDTWEEVRRRAKEHTAELAEALGVLDGQGDEGPEAMGAADVHAVMVDVRTFLGAKGAEALAYRFDLATEAIQRGAVPGVPVIEAVAGELLRADGWGDQMGTIARELQPGGRLVLTIHGPPAR